jgi:hypothetical protein
MPNVSNGSGRSASRGSPHPRSSSDSSTAGRPDGVVGPGVFAFGRAEERMRADRRLSGKATQEPRTVAARVVSLPRSDRGGAAVAPRRIAAVHGIEAAASLRSGRGRCCAETLIRLASGLGLPRSDRGGAAVAPAETGRFGELVGSALARKCPPPCHRAKAAASLLGPLRVLPVPRALESARWVRLRNVNIGLATLPHAV